MKEKHCHNVLQERKKTKNKTIHLFFTRMHKDGYYIHSLGQHNLFDCLIQRMDIHIKYFLFIHQYEMQIIREIIILAQPLNLILKSLKNNAFRIHQIRQILNSSNGSLKKILCFVPHDQTWTQNFQIQFWQWRCTPNA